MSSTTMRDASRAPTGAEPLVGKKVGKYEIVRVIGKGGMGCVYEAVNPAINKRVAMKCIDHALAANEEANARFQREAISASAVDSAHIVQIFDAGTTDDGTPFIVMELLRGKDLGGYITERGKLGVEETLHITAQILKGLHHAHEAGIVHRDLKPDNVFLVEREGEPHFVKLLDFGVSKIARSEKDVPLETLTRQGTVVGTPYYMSPEQAQAFPDVDGRTDIYSVGAIMYECLAARPPHTGQSYEQVIVNICMKDVPPIHELEQKVPAAVSALVHKALGRERDERFASAREMLDALIEAAPTSLRLSTPSGGGVRLPAGAATTRPEGTRTGRISYPTERQVISTPTAHQTHELAQTVPAQPVADEDAATAETPREKPEKPDNLGSSGVTAKTATDAITVRSPEELDEVPGVPPKRSWGGLLIAGVIAAAAVTVYASLDPEPEPAAESAAPPEAPAAVASAVEPTEASPAIEPPAPAAATTSAPTTTSAVSASKIASPHPPAAPKSPPVAPKAPTPTPPPPVPAPKTDPVVAPKPPSLELQEDY
jgi:eukaryotic-like serine/threonine-protein kinase